MLFSGTRGAFPLVPAGLLLFAILKFNRKILIGTAIAGVFVVGLIFLPTSNQNILRFQSAFRPNEDASYKVRQMNQARIKPYIWSHPFGGGLGSTGEWGKKFAPGSYLSTFPPDSGYVRTTVELGYIGLTIFCILIFVILKTGITNYYKIKDPELKAYCLAMILMVFAWNIANFPQEALVQYPSNVIFYLTVALMNIAYRIDKEQQQNLLQTNATY
jgi:O-antigen ligase